MSYQLLYMYVMVNVYSYIIQYTCVTSDPVLKEASMNAASLAPTPSLPPGDCPVLPSMCNMRTCTSPSCVHVPPHPVCPSRVVLLKRFKISCGVIQKMKEILRCLSENIKRS